MQNEQYKDLEEYVRGCAEDLVRLAMKHGIVLTIKTVPRAPFAMGNYDVEVETRPLRSVRS